MKLFFYVLLITFTSINCCYSQAITQVNSKNDLEPNKTLLEPKLNKDLNLVTFPKPDKDNPIKADLQGNKFVIPNDPNEYFTLKVKEETQNSLNLLLIPTLKNLLFDYFGNAVFLIIGLLFTGFLGYTIIQLFNIVQFLSEQRRDQIKELVKFIDEKRSEIDKLATRDYTEEKVSKLRADLIDKIEEKIRNAKFL